jgi:hypothetical protein
MMSMAEKAAGLQPGALGGFENISGHFKIDYKPGQKITVTQFHEDYGRAETRARKEAYAASRAGAGGSSRGRLGGGLGGDPGGAGKRAGGTGPK